MWIDVGGEDGVRLRGGTWIEYNLASRHAVVISFPSVLGIRTDLIGEKHACSYFDHSSPNSFMATSHPQL
jgi:hypothetical protein